MFGTVCRHNDTVAPGSKILDHIHKELLVGVIQAGRGLVHHKDFSRLADRAGDLRQLALSSAEGGVFFIGKLQGIDLIKSLKGCITIDSLRTVKGRKMGSIPLSGGRILIDGQDHLKLSPRELANRIAYIPQYHSPVFSYTVLDVVLMGRASHFSAFPISAGNILQL